MQASLAFLIGIIVAFLAVGAVNCRGAVSSYEEGDISSYGVNDEDDILSYGESPGIASALLALDSFISHRMCVLIHLRGHIPSSK